MSHPLSTRRPPGRRRTLGYWPYLVPGAVGFAAIVAVPFLGNIYLSFTKWSGVGQPRWIGLDNYRRLLQDDVFWHLFQNTVAMIVAMTVVPTLIGLVLASVLFDVVGRRFGARTASAL